MLTNYKYFDKHEKPVKDIGLAPPRVPEDDNFFGRYLCMQELFLKCSSVRKFHFLKELFEYLKNFDYMPDLYRSLRSAYLDKTNVYISMEGSIGMPSQNPLRDRDRCVELKELEKTLDDTKEWFKELDEKRQKGIFLTLMVMGGRVLIKSLIDYIKPRIPPRKVVPDPIPIRVENNEYDAKYDRNIPEVAEWFKKRKEWDEMIERYRKKLLASQAKDTSEGKKGKGDKSKKGKSSKSKKRSKSPKHIDLEIDYVQLLPIWIMKRIFSYLDKKTLTHIKAVNASWKYAVESLEKDVKARKSLNEAIKKLEAEIRDPIKFTTKKPECLPKRHELNVGTCSKSLHKQLQLKKEPKCELSAICDAFTNRPNLYDVAITNMKPFSRKKPIANELYAVYKPPYCHRFSKGIRERKLLEADKDETTNEFKEKMRIINPQDSVENLEMSENEETCSTFFSPDSEM